MSKINEDNGSQQWFDATMRARIQQNVANKQQRGQQTSKSYLDQKVNVQQQNQPTEIHDPYIKKLVESRQQQPFYSAAHLGNAGLDRSRGGDYEINIDMDSFQSAIQKKQMELGVPSQIPDADLNQIFGRQNSNQQLPGIHNNQQAYQQPSQNNQTVTLLQGHPVYRPIHQENGGGFVLAREVGAVNEQLAMQQYIARGTKNVYIVPQHQTQINIQEIQNNPRMLTTLVEVHAPPMASLGPLLVPAQAIAGMYVGGSRQLITDSKQHQYIPQQQMVQQRPQTQQQTQYGFPVKRGILKG